MEIRLTHTWTVGNRIGGGGFGQVYEAHADGQPAAVAKLVPKAPGAARELLFVQLDGARNVIPVIDSGETDDAWVLVMPRAEKSLRQHMDELGGPMSIDKAIDVLADVTTALVDLDGKVVHRDLKPDNVLLLAGHWCLADFGISRYAEATTAPDTRKHAMSPAYAAPERWRDERATGATDVYALGVIAYELLAGARPFNGPAAHDLREQHLHADPASLQAVPAPLAALVEECLYKAPGASCGPGRTPDAMASRDREGVARPSPGNVAARLVKIAAAPSSSGVAKLQEANRAEVVRRGESSRRESEARTDAEWRAEMFDAAASSIRRIGQTLRDTVEDAATAAAISGGDSGWAARLADATLTVGACQRTAADPWGGWKRPAFTVIAHTSVSIKIPVNRQQYEGRSHSLWYCDALEADRYQWFETAFMVSPLIPKRGRQDPFALDPSEASAKAVWNGMAEWQVAWPFTPLVVGDLDEFTGRWCAWFADAAQGRLQLPSTMPERPTQESWRRS